MSRSQHVDSTDSVPGADPGEALETLVWSGSRNRCHIPHDGGTRCGIEGDLRRKGVETVPPAHREWCRRCLACWTAAEAPE
ncbi:hypothetical protein [Haloglomus litoreum]|uniref:hypothetical protein n=1 Tax=Haloglomus litoreum TaxID=3034026 RepID=UPI0023E7DD85|nr:hypothetical protein [Haloglomus sp. DT116]